MKQLARKAWKEVIRPAIRRPEGVQLAALCYRMRKDRTEVLLVNSSSGRWILPKGWPIDGLNGPQTVMREAWEEAGVRRGKPAEEPFVTYPGVKRMDNGAQLACDVHVYEVKVKERSDRFPESGQRNPKWVTIPEALRMVDDPALIEVLTSFAERQSPR